MTSVEKWSWNSGVEEARLCGSHPRRVWSHHNLEWFDSMHAVMWHIRILVYRSRVRSGMYFRANFISWRLRYILSRDILSVGVCPRLVMLENPFTAFLRCLIAGLLISLISSFSFRLSFYFPFHHLFHIISSHLIIHIIAFALHCMVPEMELFMAVPCWRFGRLYVFTFRVIWG